MSIPPWTGSGILPPIRPGEPGISSVRSPYQVSLVSVVERFATTPERIRILDGLLRYRHDLSDIGIREGFQWLGGSFMEDVERTENRPPNDLDVVNFLDLNGAAQDVIAKSHPDLFRNDLAKSHYILDVYTHVLMAPMTNHDVKRVAYWYSMWAHQRSGVWKGFLQIDIDPAQDADARKILDERGGTSHGG